VHRQIQERLVAWFRAGHRDMPWRRTRDPYAIWISEIMLQQTRVETVTPYFEKWMARFPSVSALAKAPLDDVLERWAGLGYYARARNLHAAAREIETAYGGRFPSEREAVRALPGIGPYTAGAILSIAFGQPEPILDGNVMRVLSRVFAIEGAVDDTVFKKKLWALAAELVPADAASDFNQAMMELGAMVCSPRGPDCARCPLAGECAAHAAGAEERYPAPKAKRPVPSVRQVTVLLERDGRVLLVRRPPAGLWGGLWEPPTGELERGEDPAAAAARVAKACTGYALSDVTELDRFEHVLTHRRMQFSAFRARPRGRLKLDRYDAARWLDARAAKKLGVSAWTARLLRSLA
jgi:A/G-specific adenine glycosylase